MSDRVNEAAPVTEAGLALLDLIGTKGWPATIRDIDRGQFADFLARIEREATERATAAVDVERLTRVLRYSPMHWEVRRPDGAFVMTRMFESADEAAAAIATEYARLSGESE